jgi:hypothetical protein
MKNILLTAFFLTLLLNVKAGPGDTTLPWDYSTTLQLNFQQLQLKNWQGGGDNTLGLNGFLEQNANYIKGKKLWTNRLNMAYGFVRLGNKQQPFIKSDDDLRFSSKYTYSFKPKWNYVAALDFRSFISPGYEYTKDSEGVARKGKLLSSFFSPAYFLTGVGVEYRPVPVFSVALMPVSVKTTIVTNDSLAAVGAYALPGQHLRMEFGAELKSVLKWEFVKNVEVQNELNLFSNYKKPTSVDVLENFSLLIKANKYIVAKFGLNVLYDEDIKIPRADGTVGPATQIKQALMIGLQYSH